MRNKVQYRILPIRHGWQIQVKRFFIWWKIPNFGPFGHNGEWFTIDGAKDKLYYEMMKSAFNNIESLRAKRIMLKNKMIGPIALSALEQSNPGADCAAQAVQSSAVVGRDCNKCEDSTQCHPDCPHKERN